MLNLLKSSHLLQCSRGNWRAPDVAILFSPFKTYSNRGICTICGSLKPILIDLHMPNCCQIRLYCTKGETLIVHVGYKKQSFSEAGYGEDSCDIVQKFRYLSDPVPYTLLVLAAIPAIYKQVLNNWEQSGDEITNFVAAGLPGPSLGISVGYFGCFRKLWKEQCKVISWYAFTIFPGCALLSEKTCVGLGRRKGCINKGSLHWLPLQQLDCHNMSLIICLAIRCPLESYQPTAQEPSAINHFPVVLNHGNCSQWTPHTL